MAKKIKRNPTEYVDPNLEEVDEDRAFEVELDDETNEIVFVHHYRRKWGDGFDADVEHGMNIEEAGQLVAVMLSMIQEIQEKSHKELLVEKSTPDVKESNPLKDNPTQ
jgi:hypothetical protein